MDKDDIFKQIKDWKAKIPPKLNENGTFQSSTYIMVFTETELTERLKQSILAICRFNKNTPEFKIELVEATFNTYKEIASLNALVEVYEKALEETKSKEMVKDMIFAAFDSSLGFMGLDEFTELFILEDSHEVFKEVFKDERVKDHLLSDQSIYLV